MSDSIQVAPTILTRQYQAPMQLVFEAWTKIEHLVNWNFPFKGVVCEYTQTDICEGGQTLHKMTMPNGFEIWMLTKYESINPFTSLSFLQYTCDEKGNKLPNPQIPNWPKDLRTTINLTEHDNTTTLELIWQPVNPTQDEADAFESSRENHKNGWGAGMQMLSDYLDALSS